MDEDDDLEEGEEDLDSGQHRSKSMLLPKSGLLSRDSGIRIWSKGKHSSVETNFWLLTEGSAGGNVYDDKFTGSGNLSTHTPDVGGAYADAGSAPLSDGVLNGTGGLPLPVTSGTVVAGLSAATATPTGDWVLGLDVAFTAKTEGDTGTIVFGGVKTDDGTPCVHINIDSNFFDGTGDWRWNITIYDAVGSVLYNPTKVHFHPTGLVQQFRVTVSSSAFGGTDDVSAYLDNVLVFNTDIVPEAEPDHAYIQVSTANVDTMAVVDEAYMATAGSTDGDPIMTEDDIHLVTEDAP